MRVLYISYDGMTDPLGRSQVIPYLTGLARLGHEITLMSFEKEYPFSQHAKKVEALLKSHRIDWKPLMYHARPPVLSTLKDLRSGKRMAKMLHAEKPFNFIHARSYISALIALSFHRRFGLPFLFDMRGFWADERVEGGLWSLRNPLFKTVYRYFKKKEKQYFEQSAHVVSLTELGKSEIVKMRIPGVSADKISVIPCCTDMDLFRPLADFHLLEDKRKTLDIPENARVISYLGSFGTWYMAVEMLDFFRQFLQSGTPAIFLIITKEPPEQVLAMAEHQGIAAHHLRVVAAEREEVPVLLALSHYTLFFIRPTFSKKASSPTKMGEALSMGIPVICNDGIGDCSTVLQEGKAGWIVQGFHNSAYQETILELNVSPAPDPQTIRAVAARHFDLKKGVEIYHQIYQRITTHDIS